MPRKSSTALVYGATIVGFLGATAWIADRLARTISDSTTAGAQTFGAAVSSVVTDLTKLVGIVEPVDLVPQQLDADYERGSIFPPGWDFDDQDWTDTAEAEMDPRIVPEQVLLPLEQRHVLTGIPAPDLSGENW